MTHHPPPITDEDLRLEALYRTHILDTPSEERFDRLTRLARQLFDVPIAMVTLVDRHRQWFKSCQGLSLSEIPRNVSFCAHAIAQNELLEVQDALTDARFAGNPLVAGDPHIRFYAGFPILSYDGYPIGTLCLIDRQPRHLTPRQRDALCDLAHCVEQEANHLVLYEALADLQGAQQSQVSALSAWAGFMSHVHQRIQSPLCSVLGDLADWEHETLLSPPQRQRVQRTRQAALEVHQLVNAVLEFTQVASEQTAPVLNAFDVHRLVSDALSARAPQAQRQRVELVADVPLDLPRRMLGNAPSIARVLGLLLDNALAHTHDGVIAVCAGVRSDARGPVTLEMEVQDSGCGIDPERQKAFARLFQSQWPVVGPAQDRPGMGLTIANSRVRRMGGRLWIRSAVREGCTVGFTASIGQAPSPDHHDPKSRWSGLDGRRVLLAQRQSSVRSIYERSLSDAGAEVTDAISAQGALALAQASRFDLMVLDSQLLPPGSDALLQALREQLPADARLILLTAGAGAEPPAPDGVMHLAKGLAGADFLTALCRLAAGQSTAQDEPAGPLHP